MNQSELKIGVIGQCNDGATILTKAETARFSGPRRRPRDFPNLYLYSCSYLTFVGLSCWLSYHDSTLFDSWFDPVRLMIRPCSTPDWTLFDSWFDPVRPMIRPCSTHDSTLFDPWLDPVRLMIRLYSTIVFVRPLNLRRKSDSVRPCRKNHESNTSTRVDGFSNKLILFFSEIP